MSNSKVDTLKYSLKSSIQKTTQIKNLRQTTNDKRQRQEQEQGEGQGQGQGFGLGQGKG